MRLACRIPVEKARSEGNCLAASPVALMYTLLDFGSGRKLEKIAGRLVNRPCPLADNVRPEDSDWPTADATFYSGRDHLGDWKTIGNWNEPWIFRGSFGALRLSLTPFGHVGLFPEQNDNREWIQRHAADVRGKRILNLFAFTGGTTLALARSGALVTHVDSARNMVERARENTVLSGLEDHPIRWIVEDAKRFAERELRRGNFYDGVVLDPPTWGHGISRGQRWEIDRDLPELLQVLADLAPACQFLMITCHTAGYTSGKLRNMIRDCFSMTSRCVHDAGTMTLSTPSGRTLESGEFARWIATGMKSGELDPGVERGNRMGDGSGGKLP